MQTRPRFRVALHELWDESLQRAVATLLVDTMGLETVDGLLQSPDLVLAMVNSADVQEVIGIARAFASPAPVVALMSITDERVAARAGLAGAVASYAFDTPIASLQAIVDAALPATGAHIRYRGKK